MTSSADNVVTLPTARLSACDVWMVALQRAAPAAQLAMLHTLAALLAGRADSDALLIVADALTEAAAEMELDSRTAYATTLRQLAGVLRTEAPQRA